MAVCVNTILAMSGYLFQDVHTGRYVSIKQGMREVCLHTRSIMRSVHRVYYVVYSTRM